MVERISAACMRSVRVSLIQVISTPSDLSSCAMKRVSARSGMLSSISGSADSNDAACSFSAEFLAP
jgi:hypothetical protein